MFYIITDILHEVYNRGHDENRKVSDIRHCGFINIDFRNTSSRSSLRRPSIQFI